MIGKLKAWLDGPDGESRVSPEIERHAAAAFMTICLNAGWPIKWLLFRQRSKMISILEDEFRYCQNSTKQFALFGGYGPISENFQSLDGFESDPKAPFANGETMAFLGKTYHSEGFVKAKEWHIDFPEKDADK